MSFRRNWGHDHYRAKHPCDAGEAEGGWIDKMHCVWSTEAPDDSALPFQRKNNMAAASLVPTNLTRLSPWPILTGIIQGRGFWAVLFILAQLTQYRATTVPWVHLEVWWSLCIPFQNNDFNILNAYTQMQRITQRINFIRIQSSKHEKSNLWCSQTQAS